MNHNSFLWYLQIWCLVVCKPFYQAALFCNTRCHFSKHFCDQLHFFRREFMNNYKLHNHKFMTKNFCAGHYWWQIMFKRIISCITVAVCLICGGYFNLQIQRNLWWFINIIWLLVAIVHKRDLKKIMICAAIAR